MQNSIQEQAKMVEQDYLHIFLKKLKLYSKRVPKTGC